MAKLEIEQVCMKYENEVALRNISFHVNAGEFLSILGPSGCGKTTLLRILIGLLKPDQGEIRKDGVNITPLSPAARGMGIVFQNYALFPNMTVLENIQYALKFQKDKKDNARAIAARLVDKMGLKDYADQKPGKLSGGQQQRVAIARTLALNPDILLFDEPMSALDIATRLSLRHELKKIQKEFSSTMIYITHDQEEAFALSDRVMVMDKGNIQQLASPEEILQNPANAHVENFVVYNLRRKIESLARYERYIRK